MISRIREIFIRNGAETTELRNNYGKQSSVLSFNNTRPKVLGSFLLFTRVGNSSSNEKESKRQLPLTSHRKKVKFHASSASLPCKIRIKKKKRKKINNQKFFTPSEVSELKFTKLHICR
ncbi:hypothetical protein PUN28_019812 [Cardiocondyla obscurior]|uniref:Uncharacterized protein n=1 Tax=Cardiocondyla obscurior TaxID=286306 RepID=A0AAW2E9M2_9HYME